MHTRVLVPTRAAQASWENRYLHIYMYVCMHARIYIYIYTHIHIHYAYMHTRVLVPNPAAQATRENRYLVCMYVRKYVRMCVCCMPFGRMDICLYIVSRIIHTYVHTYIHTYIDTYVYIYVYIYISMYVSPKITCINPHGKHSPHMHAHTCTYIRAFN
jgi:hypothetical protein